jgi:hypothetical protein
MQYPKTRAEAKALKSKYYLTGSPCPRGHYSVRFTSVGTCKECGREKAMEKFVPLTDRKRSYTDLEGFIAVAKELHNGVYTYPNAVYKNAHTHLKIECPIHGEFLMNPTNHTHGKGKGCSKCGSIRGALAQVKDTKTFIAEAIAKWGSKFDYSEVDYRGAKVSVIIRCNEHPENQNLQHPTNHLSGQNPCSKCNKGTSGEELQIADFLAQYTKVESGNMKLIYPKQIDIYLPEFKLGIEYHGLWCHITETEAGDNTPYTKTKNYHREKYEAANKAGIRLVQIFADEWVDKPDIIKNRLLAFIGKAPTYYARNLTLSRIEMAEARPFLVATHIQGAGIASYCYALKNGNTIIAAATFCKSRSGAMTGAKAEGKWEVARYASIGRVQGGFSRLLKRFKADVDPNEIISYCDLRYGNGGLYKATGFTLASITEPDYWWVPKNEVKRIPRYSVQKHKMADPKHILNKFYAPDKTENQICTEAGYSKIHGVGSQKWEWKK